VIEEHRQDFLKEEVKPSWKNLKMVRTEDIEELNL